MVLSGCATRQAFTSVKVSRNQLTSFLTDKPERLKPGYSKILEDGQRNFVLNHMRVGLDALQLGYYNLATSSFDHAVLGIERVYADNPQAQKARSLWYEEGMKDFKGEPYERAMAYYYRGLLYMQERDFENARACFKSGVIQDAFAEEEQRRCDFALLIFLEGWTSLLLGDKSLSDEAFKEVKKLRPDFDVPSRESNVLLIVEIGNSPRKVADGVGHAELKFRRGRNFDESRVEFSIAGADYSYLYPIEDIAWQAMTRGGRPVDKILEGQVVFRQSHEDAGTVLTDVACNALIAAPLLGSASQGVQNASAALGLLGVAQMAVAARARPHADIRYWDNLPNAVCIAALKLKPGEYSIHLKFLDQSGSEIYSLRKVLDVKVPEEPGLVIWERSRKQIYSD